MPAYQRTVEALADYRPAAPTIFVLSAVPTWAEQGDLLRILLRDNDAAMVALQPSRQTAHSWEQRQIDLAGGPAAPDNVAVRVLVAMKEIATIAAESASPTRTFAVGTDLPWWRQPPAAEFEPPEVGDFRVAAAYQLAYLFYYGVNPESAPATCHFLPGCVLARYEGTLRKTSQRARAVLRPTRTVKNRTDRGPQITA